jgi:hypothetical protein
MLLLSAGAWSLSTSCALFTDLNSDPYRLADAGAAGGQCAADAGADASCPLVFSAGCMAACSSTQVCCVTATGASALNGMCMDPSACSSQAAPSAALCTAGGPSDQCPPGGSCIAQTCTFGGASFSVHACSLIPSCKSL